MLHRKLLEILSRLPAGEHKRLRMFLLSPYYNSGSLAPKLVDLYDYVMQQGADETSTALDKQEISKIFYPDRPFREKEKGPVDHLASTLFQLVRDFLDLRSMEPARTEGRKLLSLAQFYRKHSLEERFWQTMQAIAKTQAESVQRDPNYFWLQFEIEEELASFRSLFLSHEEDFNLSAVHHKLDTFYTVLKLEHLCINLLERKISKPSAAPNPILAEAILSLPMDDELLSEPLTQAFRLAYDLLESPKDEEKLKKLESLLREHRAVFPEGKFYNLQTFYRSFWGSLYQSQGLDYSRRLFELYRQQFEEGFLYLEGQLHSPAYRVLVYLGLRHKAFDWVKNLLDTHPPELISGTRYPQEFHRLNYGEYHFARGEYDEANRMLNFLAFESANYSLQVDVLLIKIYYETHDQLLEPRMRAFEQRVRRTRIPQNNKDQYYNFIKKLDKFVKYGWQKNSPKLQKLAEEIRTTPAIIEREWLLEKLGAITERAVKPG
jgi:hypothetical protein